MSTGKLINFPAPRAPKFAEIEVQHSLGATIDTGVWLHGFILDGLQAGKFAGSTAAAKSALCEALLHTFAVPELVAIVEGHFEQVYGCNPLTFLGRIKACREKADRR